MEVSTVHRVSSLRGFDTRGGVVNRGSEVVWGGLRDGVVKWDFEGYVKG